eukprot:3460737-Pyramimonas_sp.AAC.1
MAPMWPPRRPQDGSKTAKMAQSSPRVPQEAPKRPALPFPFFLIILLFLDHVFPEGVPNKLGEHMVR